jgi:hypothetical protein
MGGGRVALSYVRSFSLGEIKKLFARWSLAGKDVSLDEDHRKDVYQAKGVFLSKDGFHTKDSSCCLQKMRRHMSSGAKISSIAKTSLIIKILLLVLCLVLGTIIGEMTRAVA